MGGLGSGPKRKLSTLMRESIDQDRENLPAYFDKLYERTLYRPGWIPQRMGGERGNSPVSHSKDRFRRRTDDLKSGNT